MVIGCNCAVRCFLPEEWVRPRQMLQESCFEARKLIQHLNDQALIPEVLNLYLLLRLFTRETGRCTLMKMVTWRMSFILKSGLITELQCKKDLWNIFDHRVKWIYHTQGSTSNSQSSSMKLSIHDPHFRATSEL